VARAIQSAIDQKECDIEVIVIDDASTDNSRKVLEEMQKKVVIRTAYLEDCQGAGNARNVGLEMAEGEMIAFLDADDTWITGKLATQIAYMEAHRVGFCSTQYERLNEENGARVLIKSPPVTNYHQALACNPIGTSTVVIRADVLGELRFGMLRRRQDYLLWLNVLKQGARIHCLSLAGTVYSHGNTNALSANKLKSIKYNWRVLMEMKITRSQAIFYFVNQMVRSFLKNRGMRWW
jgi:teichuronic acid biosynthesis glycosyltransferase TuaG